MIDVPENDLTFIVNTIKEYVPDCEILAFGSRINGKSKFYSDLDIAIISKEKIKWLLIEEIKTVFAESDIPYRIDLLDFNSISENFRNVIEKESEVVEV